MLLKEGNICINISPGKPVYVPLQNLEQDRTELRLILVKLIVRLGRGRNWLKIFSKGTGVGLSGPVNRINVSSKLFIIHQRKHK